MSEMNAKIMAVIERLGATEMAAEIITDIVARGLGKLGGRPKERPVATGYEPVTKPDKPVLKPVESGISGDLFSDPSSSPESSKPTKEDVNTNGTTVALAFPPEKNAFGKALAQFCEIWRTRYGVYYEPTSADRNQLGRMVKGLSARALEDLPRAFRAYLGDLSPFVAQEQRHSLKFFCTSGGMNKYRASAPVLSKREANSVAAGEQWLALQEASDAAE